MLIISALCLMSFHQAQEDYERRLKEEMDGKLERESEIERLVGANRRDSRKKSNLCNEKPLSTHITHINKAFNLCLHGSVLFVFKQATNSPLFLAGFRRKLKCSSLRG